jgi:predicted nucleotidyltransferase
MALFGSILGDEFRLDSDVDVLISFSPDAPWSLFDFITMEDELEKVFKRPVDLVEREGLHNPFRRRHILNNMEIIYGPATA